MHTHTHTHSFTLTLTRSYTSKLSPCLLVSSTHSVVLLLHTHTRAHTYKEVVRPYPFCCASVWLCGFVYVGLVVVLFLPPYPICSWCCCVIACLIVKLFVLFLWLCSSYLISSSSSSSLVVLCCSWCVFHLFAFVAVLAVYSWCAVLQRPSLLSTLFSFLFINRGRGNGHRHRGSVVFWLSGCCVCLLWLWCAVCLCRAVVTVFMVIRRMLAGSCLCSVLWPEASKREQMFSFQSWCWFWSTRTRRSCGPACALSATITTR